MSDKIKKTKIFLLGEAYHSKSLHRQLQIHCGDKLEIEFSSTLPATAVLQEFDVFHLISAPLSVIRKVHIGRKPVIYHWIGTDVYRFINDQFLKRFVKKILIKSSQAMHLSVSETLQRELANIGIGCGFLPLSTPTIPGKVSPLSKKFSVLIYIPQDRWDFYHGDLIMKIVYARPEIDFYLVGSGPAREMPQNLCALGSIKDMEPLYAKTNALLRMTIHDGLPKMLLEALSYGRHVLWSQPFPHCHHVTNRDDCLRVLDMLKQKPALNLSGRKFFESDFHPKIIAEKYARLYLGESPEKVL